MLVTASLRRTLALLFFSSVLGCSGKTVAPDAPASSSSSGENTSRRAAALPPDIVEPGGSESSVPAGYEPIELDEGRLSPAVLIEDELIVAIPLVPKHARPEDCGSLAHNLKA